MIRVFTLFSPYSKPAPIPKTRWKNGGIRNWQSKLVEVTNHNTAGDRSLHTQSVEFFRWQMPIQDLLHHLVPTIKKCNHVLEEWISQPVRAGSRGELN